MTGDMLWAPVALILLSAGMIIFVFAIAINTAVQEIRAWRERLRDRS